MDQQRNDERYLVRDGTNLIHISQKEEMRRAMISQILDTEARERCLFLLASELILTLLVNRISIVKPEKARAVEELIIRMWRTGQLGSRRVGESQFIDLLEQISGSTDGGSAPKVVFQRRRFDDESDDEEYTF